MPHFSLSERIIWNVVRIIWNASSKYILCSPKREIATGLCTSQLKLSKLLYITHIFHPTLLTILLIFHAKRNQRERHRHFLLILKRCFFYIYLRHWIIIVIIKHGQNEVIFAKFWLTSNTKFYKWAKYISFERESDTEKRRKTECARNTLRIINFCVRLKCAYAPVLRPDLFSVSFRFMNDSSSKNSIHVYIYIQINAYYKNSFW